MVFGKNKGLMFIQLSAEVKISAVNNLKTGCGRDL